MCAKIRKVTLKDISKVCKFSISTISLALNNNSQIQASTREKIHRIASQLSYQSPQKWTSNCTLSLETISFLREQNNRKVTIYHIAKQLGVSAATVSRALNSGKRVHKKTGKIIKLVAAEMDYKPNYFAQNLKSNHVNRPEAVSSKSVTIYDIAKQANVSASTVSRCLNNKSPVITSNRQKVLDVARDMGYSTNYAARQLKLQQSKV